MRSASDIAEGTLPRMHDDSISTALIALLENQRHRTVAALEDLPDAAWRATPGGDCNPIAGIGRHLVRLRRFQLDLLGSPRAAQVGGLDDTCSLEAVRDALAAAHDELRAAIAEHDATDWIAVPTTPREGPWGDECTLARFARPFNDYTNHLGAIRAVRRVLACGVDRTQ